jgi:hypothetical protein
MNQIKTPHNSTRVDLADIVGSSEAWGTGRGIHAYSALAGVLGDFHPGTQVILDYRGLIKADVSFEREAIVETLRRFRPGLLFVADNAADADVLANLEAALEMRSERLLVRTKAEYPRVIGRPLSEEHALTLGIVQKYSGFTSSQLTLDPYGLESSTASARLTYLWKAGLLTRMVGTAPSGGREYRYYPII